MGYDFPNQYDHNGEFMVSSFGASVALVIWWLEASIRVSGIDIFLLQAIVEWSIIP